nr:MAG TPA: hypothetical protein [Caudoviricetes sp.]
MQEARARRFQRAHSHARWKSGGNARGQRILGGITALLPFGNPALFRQSVPQIDCNRK